MAGKPPVSICQLLLLAYNLKDVNGADMFAEVPHELIDENDLEEFDTIHNIRLTSSFKKPNIFDITLQNHDMEFTTLLATPTYDGADRSKKAWKSSPCSFEKQAQCPHNSPGQYAASGDQKLSSDKQIQPTVTQGRINSRATINRDANLMTTTPMTLYIVDKNQAVQLVVDCNSNAPEALVDCNFEDLKPTVEGSTAEQK